MTNTQDPFDDLTNGELPDDELVDGVELADADRFAEVLDRIDAGGGVDLDPREDPTLAALTTVSAQLRDTARESTSTPRFESYRARSRDYLLHRIEREREALAAPASREPEREHRRGVAGIPFLRWNVLSPIASAAAAAVAVLAFVALNGADTPGPAAPEQAAVVDTPAAAPVADDEADAQDTAEPVAPQPDPVRATFWIPSGQPDGEQLLDQFASAVTVRTTVDGADDAVAALDETTTDEPAGDTPADEADPAPVRAPAAVAVAPQPVAVTPPASVAAQRPTPRTVPEQLDYIETLLGELTVQVERQEPVPGRLLRELTESIAAVAYRIEANPDEVTHAQVVAYIHAAADGRFLLAAAVADESDEAALNAARRVAQDGVVVAGWYFKYR